MKKIVMVGTIIIPALAVALLATARPVPKPDLVVKEMWTTGAASLTREGILLPVAVRVENIGTAAAGPFRVAVLKALEDPAGGQREVKFSTKQATGGLKARGSLDVTGTIDLAPRSEAGRRIEIRAFVDSQNRVDESNEGNNFSAWIQVRLPAELRPAGVALKPMPVRRLPDLTVTESDITVTPTPPLAGSGEDMRVEIVIRNAGMVEARDVTVITRLVDASGRSAAHRSATIPSIAGRGDQRTTVVFGSNLYGAGTYRFLVEIDRRGTIEESNEDNNSAEKALNILGPELSVATVDIEISPSMPRAGESFSFIIPVRNHGDGDAVNVLVRWEITDDTGRVVMESRGRGLTMERIPAHGFNIETRRSVSFGTGMEGDYALRIIVDPDNRMVESDESDNRAEKLFKVLR